MIAQATWRHATESPVGACYEVVEADGSVIVRYPYKGELQRSTAYNQARWEAQDINKRAQADEGRS